MRSGWTVQHEVFFPAGLVKVNIYTNRDSCEVLKRKTRPFKDTKCADCGFKYPSRKELILHRKKAHPFKYKCPTKTFKRRQDWQRHTDTQAGEEAHML